MSTIKPHGPVHWVISTLLLLNLWGKLPCQAQDTDCFVSQPNVSDIAKEFDLSSFAINIRARQYIFPSVKFEDCSGSITQINFVALGQNPNGHLIPQIQLWETTDEKNFTKVASFDINVTHLNVTSEKKFYSYAVNPALPFQSGNVLGVFSPNAQDSPFRLMLQYNRMGYSYYQPSSSSASEVRVDSLNFHSEPLISVETDNNCAVGFATTEQLQHIARTTRIVSEQLRIIPTVNFKCDGEITNWTVVADRNTGGGMRDQYPELQIWRPSGIVPSGFNRIDVVKLNKSRSISTDVYTGMLSPPIHFLAGDIPSLYLPPFGENVLRMFVLIGMGPVNYIFESNLLTVVVVANTSRKNEIPLISLGVVYSTPSPSNTFQLSHTTTSNGVLSTTSTATFASTVVSVGPVSVSSAKASAPTVSTLVSNSYSSIRSSKQLLEISDTSVLTRTQNQLFSSSPRKLITLSSTRELEVTTTFLYTSGATLQTSPLLNPKQSITKAITARSVISRVSLSVSIPVVQIPANTIPLTSTIGISVGIVVGLLLLLALVISFVLLLKRRHRKYKLPPVITSDAGIPNPVYSTAEDTVLANGGTVRGQEMLDQTYAELSNDNDQVTESTEERDFENPLYSDRNEFESETQLDVSLYATANPLGLSKGLGNFYVPTTKQRENSTLQTTSSNGTENTIYDSVYAAMKEDKPYEFFSEEPLYWRPSSQESELYEQLSRRKYREIPFTELRVSECIGSGQFGSVERGVWNSPDGPKEVAIKSLKENSIEEDKVKLFQEAAINGQFHHPSIVALHGVVTLGKKPMIVLELMGGGNMRDFLPQLQSRVEKDECSAHKITTQCLDYCCQIATGMKYLSDKQFVHRDLAARNILMSRDGLECKISDFGMARDLEDSDYYVSRGGMIPVKWTAPEAINYKKYSSASDVWSFGALLYEIWSLGRKPFEGMNNMKVIRKVSKGYRLPPPPGCPKAIYQLMINCWHPESKSRPTFSEVTSYLNQSQSTLLNWESSDTAVHHQAALLGALIEAGFDLYPDLQKVYANKI